MSINNKRKNTQEQITTIKGKGGFRPPPMTDEELYEEGKSMKECRRVIRIQRFIMNDFYFNKRKDK